jgi:hypothetical protein
MQSSNSDASFLQQLLLTQTAPKSYEHNRRPEALLYKNNKQEGVQPLFFSMMCGYPRASSLLRSIHHESSNACCRRLWKGKRRLVGAMYRQELVQRVAGQNGVHFMWTIKYSFLLLPFLLVNDSFDDEAHALCTWYCPSDRSCF